MTTRREIVKAVAGFAGILAAGEAPASVVKSLIGMRNGLMAGKRLPYDAEVEYLESTGTQWIDTGLYLDATARIHVGVVCHTNNNLAVYGCCNGNAYNKGEIALFQRGNLWDSVFPTGQDSSELVGGVSTAIPGFYVGEYFDIVDDESSVSINGTLYTRNRFQEYACRRSLVLFAVHRDVVQYKNNCSIFFFKVKLDGKIVRDFITVRFTNELGQTEGAMYDRVSGQLFRNAGTGDFVVGPDK